MEEINRFVMLARSGCFSVTDLCERFGVMPKAPIRRPIRRRHTLTLDKPPPSPPAPR
jgi:hypothetical protein